jgi:hypothetical protein
MVNRPGMSEEVRALQSLRESRGSSEVPPRISAEYLQELRVVEDDGRFDGKEV